MTDPYQVGTGIAFRFFVNPLDFFVTYLAIGSAFAMRAYFLNRHRRAVFVFRSVISELVFWLPKLSFRSIRKFTVRPASMTDASYSRRSLKDELDCEAHIKGLLESLDSTIDRKRVREALEIYVALRSACITAEAEPHPPGQFELFDVAGHLNGRAGTACLFRKNLAHLRTHSQRHADRLIHLFRDKRTSTHPDSSLSILSALFDAYGDMEAIRQVNLTTSRSSFEVMTANEEFSSEIAKVAA